MNHIIIFLSYFLLQITIIKIFQNIIKKDMKYSIEKLLPVIIISSTINTLLYIFNLTTINALANYFYFFLIIKIQYSINYKETVFNSIIVWLLSCFLDIIVMVLVSFLDKNFLMKYIDQIKIIYTIIIIAILWCISKIPWFTRTMNKVSKKLNEMNYSNFPFLVLIIVFIIVDIICVYHLQEGNMIIVIAIISLIFILSFLCFIYLKYSVYTLKETNKLLRNNSEYYFDLIMEYRKLKHNLVNKLLGIKNIANKEVSEIIEDLILEYDKNYQKTEDLIKIPNAINGLVYEKIKNIKRKKLNITINNKVDKDILYLIGGRSYNLLCESLGVVLDNAIESALLSKDKIVYLEFLDLEKLTIKVINSYSGEIDLENFGKPNYSTKGTNRGIGIFSLIGRKKIKLRNQIKNNLFTTIIEIDKINTNKN